MVVQTTIIAIGGISSLNKGLAKKTETFVCFDSFEIKKKLKTAKKKEKEEKKKKQEEEQEKRKLSQVQDTQVVSSGTF